MSSTFAFLLRVAIGFEINWLYIVVPCAAIGALLVLLLIVLCVRRQKRKSKTKAAMKNPYCETITNGPSAMARVTGQQMEMNALLPPSSITSLQGPMANRILAPEFSLQAVRFQQDLGEGAFGKVMFPFFSIIIISYYSIIPYRSVLWVLNSTASTRGSFPDNLNN